MDVHTLSGRFDLDHLTELARELDGGFTDALLAEALASHRRFTGAEFEALGADAPQLRDFIGRWLEQLVA